jgi:hypothetical protein
VWYHRSMARLGWAMLFVLAFGPGLRAVDPPDPLSQARLLYNLG